MKSTSAVVVSLGAVAAAAMAAFAATETYNDLAPYDNTVSGGSYWTTTSHPVRSVDAVSSTMGMFDSKTCDVKAVTLQSFDSRPGRLVFIVR